MTSYRIFRNGAGTDIAGPASATSFTGSIILGMSFKTTATAWLEGYWFWVGSSQATTAQKFCLWQQVTNGPTGSLVAASVVTSGVLSAGWNFTALATPILLSPNTTYVAATGLVNNFPFTGGYFSTGGAGAAGLTGHSTTGAAGPLFAFSDRTGNGGTAANPWNTFQCSFVTGNSDPTALFPNIEGSPVGGNEWVDVQVRDTPPAGATYSMWPNLPIPLTVQGGIAAVLASDGGPGNYGGYTMSTQFSLSAASSLTRIRFYTKSGSGVLPGRCGIWDVLSQTTVASSDNASPAWKRESDNAAAAVGDGWVYCDYSSAGVVLNASQNYKVAVWAPNGQQWRTDTTPYWATTGDGTSGWVNGIITAPNAAGASPGQSSWNGPNLPWAYPNTFVNPENNWIDLVVTPLPPAATPVPLVVPQAAVMQAANW